MEQIEHKVFPSELKAFDDKALILEHVISTETKDDSGDVMLADGMKVRGKPVVLFQHGLDPRFGAEPIAKVLDVKVGTNKAGKKGVVARTQYYDGSKLNPPDNTGRRLYEKAKSNFMPNWSIGFSIGKAEPIPEGGRLVKEWNLHEYSQVSVGMNSEATTDEEKQIEELCTKMLFKVESQPPHFELDEMDGAEECKYLFPEKDDPLQELSLVNKEMKPYENEHACRLNEPSKYDEFRRKNGAQEHNGKKYDVIYGKIKGGDKWEQQAYRYPKATWEQSAAAAHCKTHSGKFEGAKCAVCAEPPEPLPDPTEEKGGAGSGNFGHEGRPGQQGGSGAGGGGKPDPNNNSELQEHYGTGGTIHVDRIEQRLKDPKPLTETELRVIGSALTNADYQWRDEHEGNPRPDLNNSFQLLGARRGKVALPTLVKSIEEKGGAGSGNFGHEGRPGQQGGSGAGGGETGRGEEARPLIQVENPLLGIMLLLQETLLLVLNLILELLPGTLAIPLLFRILRGGMKKKSPFRKHRLLFDQKRSSFRFH